ncbi:MAG: DUF2306 domain-containing protein [Bacteroidetes bacterium]|nr:DUF2306 domain-containing protein [Bacteroidota bacterium]
MWEITRQYIPYDTDVAFLRIKQEYISRDYYRWAFFLHVYTSILVLPAGFTQFSKRLRLQLPTLHRRAGYLYLVITLFLAGPGGLIIGIHANGGWSSQLAFCLLAGLWIWFSAKAWIAARNKDWDKHRNFMIRSFALALSAITLRVWKFGIVAVFEPRPMDVYRLVAWLGWVLNLIIAEWIIFKFHKK